MLAGGRGVMLVTAGAASRQVTRQVVSCQALIKPDTQQAPLQPRSIWCVGKNYLEHIKELKSVGLNIDQDVPKEPLIFLKAASCLLPSDQDTPTPLPLPTHWSSNIQHEVELAVQLGRDLEPVRAAVAIDMTARDVQATLKGKGYPWTLAKSFPAACPIGPFFDLTGVDLHNLRLNLRVNSVVRQSASTEGMIFKVPELVDYLRSRYPLEPGDLILTGTPEGVGRLEAGDVVTAWVQDNNSSSSSGGAGTAGGRCSAGPRGCAPQQCAHHRQWRKH